MGKVSELLKTILDRKLDSESLKTIGGNSLVGNGDISVEDLVNLPTIPTKLSDLETDLSHLSVGSTTYAEYDGDFSCGAAVNLTGDRAFGFGVGIMTIYLTGSDRVYQAQLASGTSMSTHNLIAKAFSQTHIGGYILSGTEYSRTSKILEIQYQGDNLPVIVTLETDLGELSKAKYNVENVYCSRSFNFGIGGNSGQGALNLGMYCFNVSNYSNTIGYKNINTGDTNNYLFGGVNKVLGGQGNVLVGYENTSSNSTFTTIAGARNENYSDLASGILGFDNHVTTDRAQAFIMGYTNSVTNPRVSDTYKNAVIAYILGDNISISRSGVCLGRYNYNYNAENYLDDVFFTLGVGDSESERNNAIEYKYNGGLYINGIGGFEGTNSTDENVKSLQEVLAEKGGTITVTGAIGEGGSFITKTTDTNGNVILDTSIIDIQLQSIIGNYTDGNPTGLILFGSTGGKIDYDKSLEINPSNYVTKTSDNRVTLGNTLNANGKESLLMGVGVNGTGDRVIGFSTAMTTAYLTGSGGTYQMMQGSKTSFTNINRFGEIIAQLHKNSYLISATDFTRVAKITDITFNGANTPMTIVLDKDLGTLNLATYALENIGGTKSLSFGVFANGGQNSVAFGYLNFNTANYSGINGYANTNTGTYSQVFGALNHNKAQYGYVLGYNSNNEGQYASVIGNDNKNTATNSIIVGGNSLNTSDNSTVLGLNNSNSGEYATIIGAGNTNITQKSILVGIGNKNQNQNYASTVLGWDNNIEDGAQAFIFGFKNHAYKAENSSRNTVGYFFGNYLNISNSGIALGYYNKDYDNTQDVSKMNFFVVGKGREDDKRNTLEQKQNGDLYVYNIGGFDGANSTEENVKPLQEVIPTKTSQLTNDSNFITASYDAETNTLNLFGV